MYSPILKPGLNTFTRARLYIERRNNVIGTIGDTLYSPFDLILTLYCAARAGLFFRSSLNAFNAACYTRKRIQYDTYDTY